MTEGQKLQNCQELTGFFLFKKFLNDLKLLLYFNTRN